MPNRLYSYIRSFLYTFHYPKKSFLWSTSYCQNRENTYREWSLQSKSGLDKKWTRWWREPVFLFDKLQGTWLFSVYASLSNLCFRNLALRAYGYISMWYSDINNISPSPLSKANSLVWTAWRICILITSIFVLLSWSICWAVARSFRSYWNKKNNIVNSSQYNTLKALQTTCSGTRTM